MKVSIITVVYNNEKTVESAIRSVLSQTYSDIEYIIIDGNSKDGTVGIIRKYEDRISKFVSENDKGIYDAMNKGVSMATGEVVGILNSDDLYTDENVIQDIINQFIKRPDLALVYGDLVYVAAEDTDKIVRKWQAGNYYSQFFENGNVPPHPALFVKKEVYETCGLFNLEYKLAADYDFMLRAFKKFGERSTHISRLMVKMRLGGATNQSFKNILAGNKEILASWKLNGLKAPIKLMPLRLFKRLIQFI